MSANTIISLSKVSWRMFLLALCILPVALPANLVRASEGLFSDQLPKLYSVSGVPTGDVLNVRSRPDGKSEIVGELTNGTVVEVTGYQDEERWARIIYLEGDGWVAVRYLKQISAPSDKDSGLPLKFSCFGTEPFWSFGIGEEADVTWSGVDQQDQKLTRDWTTRSRNNYGTSFALGAGEFTGFLQRQECSDGMSDRTYGWQLELIKASGGERQHFTGCCMWRLNQ